MSDEENIDMVDLARGILVRLIKGDMSEKELLLAELTLQIINEEMNTDG